MQEGGRERKRGRKDCRNNMFQSRNIIYIFEIYDFLFLFATIYIYLKYTLVKAKESKKKNHSKELVE